MFERGVVFEEALSEDWSRDLEVVEVPLHERPLFWLGIAVFFLGVIVGVRIMVLGIWYGDFYVARAGVNVSQRESVPAPRGLIVDRFGEVIAKNDPVFSVRLDVKEFLKKPEIQADTLRIIEERLGILPEEVWERLKNTNLEASTAPIVLSVDLDQNQIVSFKASKSPALIVGDGFKRSYPEGNIFSSVLGYVGFPTRDELKEKSSLNGQDIIGKTGLEFFYNEKLLGESGVVVRLRDAKGVVLSEEEKVAPKIGETLNLTLDADLQEYFYKRMQEQFSSLGRTSGIALAMNPQTGEILSFLNFPTYDNNLFAVSGRNNERKEILTSKERPLFNRIVSGLYSPGSTIKPLVGIAALKEGVVGPMRTVFSPGYLEIPNPYNPDQPTRFLDWRFQGEVNLYSALAQSSNVYFYAVGGGAFDIKGLGITRLREWWQKFNFGNLTGVDMPSEAKGFLPSPEWKEEQSGRPWRLGDTYNVSIGQGDLLVTPIQLLNYINAVANGGEIKKPFFLKGKSPEVLKDLRELGPEIKEAQIGMEQTIKSSMGTARTMADLPFKVAGKTGSAQVQNNTQENAFFVGYIPGKTTGSDGANSGSEFALLVLIENSREGSLNVVPVAKDVFRWYYENRIKNVRD